MSSSRRRVDHFQHHENNNTSQALHSSLLTDIKNNTANIKIDTGDIDLNTDGLEGLIGTTNTKLNGGLPSALTGSGNLKVCLQELGNEGSERLNVDVGSTVTQLPSALTGEGNLKVSIQEDFTHNLSTSANQTTQINHLSEIEGAVETLEGCVGSNKVNVNISSGAITGFATESTLSDAEVHLGNIDTGIDNIEACIGSNKVNVNISSGNITGFATASLQGGGLPSALSSDNLKVSLKESIAVGVTNTTLTNLNNCIDSNEIQVDIVGSLPTGTNAIGKLSANSGVDIGDVDVTSLPLTFNSGNKDATCQRIVVATDDVNISAIKSSLDNLDNAVDGNYLNVNANIAGTDVASNSGNKSAQTQRVCIATDDIPIALVNTKLDSIDGVLDAIKLDTEAIETAVEILDDIAIAEDTAHSTGHKGIQMLGVRQDSQADFGADGDYVPMSIDGNGDVRVKLDDVSNAVLDDIKSAVEAIDNSVDGNYLNVNANIAGTDVDSNSGNKSSATQRVVIADDDVNLSAIKTSVELLDDCIGTDNSTGPSKCISIGGTNLLGGAIQEIACDGDGHLQIDILSSALPSGASGEISNTVIATKTTLSTSAEIKELLSGVTVNAGALSSEFDTENYERIRFFGETTASVGTDIIFMGSNVSGGTYFVMGENLRSETISSTHYVYASGTENLPRYIKILNKSGSTNYVFTKLYMQLSGGRLLV